MLSITRYVFIIISLLVSTQAVFATDLNVSVDRNPVSIDETFQIIISANGDVDGNPDLSRLKKQFKILGTRESSSMNIINGSVSSEKKWILTAMALRTGKQKIPSIKIGRIQSEPVTINVLKNTGSALGSSNQDVYLKVSLSSEEALVQEQILYTIKLFHSVAIGNASLSELEFKGVDAVVEKLGKDQQYRVQVDGKIYEVFERKYAVFPQSSGKLEFNPIIFQSQSGLNSGFFADPFAPAPRTIVKRSEALGLTVKPIPAGYAGKYWLPADELKLSETWSENPPVFQVGKPITRTITLKAKGLTSSQLPELKPVLPDDLKTYPDQASMNNEIQSDGIASVRQEKMAIIPTVSGEMMLPEVRLEYWSKASKKMEVAKIPERHIQVLPASSAEVGNTPERNNDSDSQVFAKSDMLPVKKAENFADTVPNSTNYWKWLSLILATCWLATIVFWLKSNKHKSNENNHESIQNKRQAITKIKQTCLDRKPKESKKALLMWAKLNWPEQPPNNLEDLAKLMSNKMESAIFDLNKALYSQHEKAWDGEQFWSQFNDAVKNSKKKNEKNSEGDLEPLYRLN